MRVGGGGDLANSVESLGAGFGLAVTLQPGNHDGLINLKPIGH